MDGFEGAPEVRMARGLEERARRIAARREGAKTDEHGDLGQAAPRRAPRPRAWSSPRPPRAAPSKPRRIAGTDASRTTSKRAQRAPALAAPTCPRHRV